MICRPLKEGGLGFRRLKEYNVALLAKQSWRVAMNPHSLLHAILQQRYFPGSDFFVAETRQSPPFMWHSLLAARNLIVDGLQWKIGDGRSALIVGHPWLARPLTF
ncbi:UNVERIFIED_CONTAM: putative mitochondrial protein [Sesamum radiatum]|uniref:Mitochondrial protein n=1 Tax=Sesamum radiatum TaxID=300843 RepID=A0AAW2VP44_SESRA